MYELERKTLSFAARAHSCSYWLNRVCVYVYWWFCHLAQTRTHTHHAQVFGSFTCRRFAAILFCVVWFRLIFAANKKKQLYGTERYGTATTRQMTSFVYGVRLFSHFIRLNLSSLFLYFVLNVCGFLSMDFHNIHFSMNDSHRRKRYYVCYSQSLFCTFSMFTFTPAHPPCCIFERFILLEIYFAC